MSRYRNRYFLAGILLVLLGAQFRMIDSFLLNESATRVLAKVSRQPIASNQTRFGSFFWNNAPSNLVMKQIHPPRWLGLAMMAVGVVFSFHAIAIPGYRRE